MTILQGLMIVSLVLMHASYLGRWIDRRQRRIRGEILARLFTNGPTLTLHIKRALGLSIYSRLRELRDLGLVTYTEEQREGSDLPSHRYRLTELGERVVAAGLHRRIS